MTDQFVVFESADRGGDGHVDDVGAVGRLLCGSVHGSVNDDDIDAEAPKFDDNFFAELAGAEEYDAAG